MKFTLSNIQIAVEEILPILKEYKIVLFDGSMGAGKTTLIASILKHMGSSDDVSSPTFSIVNEYHSPMGKVFHFDFYRIEDEQEVHQLGIEEYFYSNHYCFIEWAQNVQGFIPDKFARVVINAMDEQTRELSISFS